VVFVLGESGDFLSSIKDWKTRTIPLLCRGFLSLGFVLEPRIGCNGARGIENVDRVHFNKAT
jgi:hypothetical protein